ncbi:hypothetical protein ACYOEI_19235 [Singulisphaera rosea]
MRLEFKAAEGGFEDEDDSVYCLICAVSGYDVTGVEHYLILQRGFEDEDPSEDSGGLCEFDDQINGAYDCVARCRLTRDVLKVELTHTIDWEKTYTSVRADLCNLDDATVAAIRAGLPRVFRGADTTLDLA